jgi:hypothetical protein
LIVSAEVSDLKNYLIGGGVIYFVVAIDDVGSAVIFYQSLLPFDLHGILRNIGKKKTKSITLCVLPDDNYAIRQIFIAFIEDRKRQSTRIVWTGEQAEEAVADGASYKFHIQPKEGTKNYFDLLKAATTQSYYLYVEIKEGVEFAFGKIEEGSSIIAQKPLDMPVYVNGIKYYDTVVHGYENGQAFLLIGHALRLPIAEEGDALLEHTFEYTLGGTLTDRIADSNFILALSNSREVVIGDAITFDLCMNNPEEITELRQLNEEFNEIKAALDYFGVQTELDMDGLTESDYSNIDDLIRASDGYEVFFVEKDIPSLFFCNKKIGNITIRIKAIKREKNDGYYLYNAFCDDGLVKLELKQKDGNLIILEPWSLYLYMKAEDFLCSNVDYSTILNSIRAMRSRDRELVIYVSENESIGVNNLLLEIITAYDSQKMKNKNLLHLAESLAGVIESKDLVTIINMFQIIRRKRPLTNEEIASLVTLRNESEQKTIACAISILLGESEEARRLLHELPPNERKSITDYPIYRLLM